MTRYQIGDELRGYVLEEKLGDGAMGAVWKGQHALLHKPVAIKALHPDLCTDAEAIRRFFREAQVVNALNHPHIVSIVDFVDGVDRPPYIIMEFLEGESLEALITPEALLSIPDSLEIARQIADAMATVHDGGIVHRDLKPDNVYVQRIDGAPNIKLLDFGLSKFQLDTHALLRTQTGSIVGTPTYMSPEQIRGKTVDHSTDIYAMGCILYGLLTGDPPFIDEQVGMLLKNHLHEPAPPPTSRVDAARAAAIPAVLERATLRCLAKAPEFRVQSMRELADLLAELQNAPSPTQVTAEAAAQIPAEAAAPRRAAMPTQKLAAVASSDERFRSPTPPRSTLLKWVGRGVVALLLGGALAAILWSRNPPHKKRGDEPHRTAATTPRPTANTGVTKRPRKGRRIRVISIPSGAALVNPRTGQTLWRTPALVLLPADRPRQLSVERKGYKSLLLTLTPQTKGPVEIALQRIATPPPRARTEPRPMDDRRAPARPQRPVDETDTVNPFD